MRMMMIRPSVRLLFSHLVRKVDHRGFNANVLSFPKKLDAEGKQYMNRVISSNSNFLLCGSLRTGKLSLLKAIGSSLEENHGRKVAYVSADHARSNRLGGFLLNHFLGLRLAREDVLVSSEQLESTFERHVRLVQTAYDEVIPSLVTIDVLVLDSLEKIPSAVFFAMEAVARRARGKPKIPFGGLRVIAAANFWEMAVVPSSDTGGYVFQHDAWGEFFPHQVLLTKTYGQQPKLTALTEKAQFGILTEEDIHLLENRNEAKHPSKKTSHSRTGGRSSTSSSTSSTTSSSSRKIPMMPLITNFEAITQKAVRFPKQRAIKILPDKYKQLKQTDMGNLLVNMLAQSTTPASYGLVDALSVEEGDHVHLLLDGGESFPVKAGSEGEVMRVRDHFITVKFFAEEVECDIPRVRVCCSHPVFPEVVYEMRQFPLFPREKLCPLTMRVHPHAYNVQLNGLRLTDTNDLGCLLARMRDFDDFTLEHTAAFAYLDNMVHEPTRIYYHQLMQKPISAGKEHWCRNCKSFVPTKDFFDHWASCVKSIRWCPECDKTIPLEQLEPHKEKHQLVLCLDCAQTVEWRFWDEHRLSCPLMMREITPLNEFLPLRTRQLALELGLDRRDLHTVKIITKANLPKSKFADQRYKSKR